MASPPIPRRIAPLAWRKPVFIWTPLALAAAIGLPPLLLRNDEGLYQFALIAGAAVFALALTSLGAAWVFGRAPRTRREVVGHVVIAGLIAALTGPLVLTRVLAAVAEYEREGAGAVFDAGMSASVTPLALVIGLPAALIAGIIFAVIALARPRTIEQTPQRDTAQP